MNKIKLCIGVKESMKSISWLSLDIKGTPDILDDANRLEKIESENCEIILAVAVLEHLNWDGWGFHRMMQTIDLLKLWKSKLCYEGLIRISVPDFDLILDVLIKYRDHYWDLRDTSYNDLIGLIYGRQINQHRMVYNFAALNFCLKEAGFSNIRKVTNISELIPAFNLCAKDNRMINIEAQRL